MRLLYLVNIINSMIVAGRFSKQWKTALVTPIAKINDAKQLSDLRPISILPCLSKVAKKVIELQIRNYLELSQILPLAQSGFTHGYSCASALMHITNDVIQAIDENKVTVMILLDYSKTFDNINYYIFLSYS